MTKHIPVMLTEALDGLQVQTDHWYLDGTFGRGGHTQAILERGGKVVAFDVDQVAIEFGTAHLADYLEKGRLLLIRENFSKLATTITELQRRDTVSDISGCLFDFGTSTEQLTSTERGFSFAGDGDLDMRMDDRLGVKAKDLLMVLSEKQLAELFIEYGGEREARAIARAIGKVREAGNFEQLHTVKGLVEIVSRAKHEPRSHLHPATKVFQALRIAVNDELGAIKEALPQALELLKPGGRLVTIAFHEGEDRIVKDLFKAWQHREMGELLTKHPLVPSEQEIALNSKSRSAKMRIFVKTV